MSSLIASTSESAIGVPAMLLAFLVVGPFLVLAIFLLRQLWKRRALPAPDKAKPPNAGCMAAFASVFILAGLASFFFITVRPTYRSWQASRWPTTPGTVLSSRLDVSHNTDGGSTYRVDVRYRYAVAGRDYESNQYDGAGTRTYSGYQKVKQQIIKAHPPGRAVTVHFDPADPADAMLSTAIPPGTFAFVWFPIVFCTVPTAMVYFLYRASKTAGKPRTAEPVKIAPAVADARGKRRRNFLAIAVFAVFWNGFITFFWLATHTWCVLPFAFIGGVLALFAGQQWLTLFNPLVSVSFARMPIHPGEPCDVAYALDGNVFTMRSLSFTLEGRESVTFRQGTDTRTETKAVYTFPLMETTKNYEMEKGRFIIKLPPDVMTSFQARNNAFVWMLVCRGDLPLRPKMKDEFDVTVLAKEAR